MNNAVPNSLNEGEIFKDTPRQTVDINEHEFEHQWKLYNARFEYAWRYFDFHAKQRTTMFNFFIIFSGFFIGACATLFKDEQYALTGILSFFGVVISLMFIFLERRNEELVHIAEDILHELEKELTFKEFTRNVVCPNRRNFWGIILKDKRIVPLGIFMRQDHEDNDPKIKKSENSHGKWLPWIELLIALIYVVFILILALPCLQRIFYHLYEKTIFCYF